VNLSKKGRPKLFAINFRQIEFQLFYFNLKISSKIADGSDQDEIRQASAAAAAPCLMGLGSARQALPLRGKPPRLFIRGTDL